MFMMHNPNLVIYVPVICVVYLRSVPISDSRIFSHQNNCYISGLIVLHFILFTYKYSQHM